MPESLLDKFTILDALENFFQDDIETIAARYAKAVTEGSKGATAKDLRNGELLEMYRETWANPLNEREKMGDFLLPPLKEGELRLPISPSPKEIASGAYVPMGADGWIYSARNQWSPQVILPSIKRTLLYAHSVVLDCQIAERAMGNNSLSATSDWLQILAQLAPLIRKGIVLITPVPNAASLPLWQKQSVIGYSADSFKDHRTRAMDAWADLLPLIVDNWAAVQAGRFTILRGRCGLSIPPEDGWKLRERTLCHLEGSLRAIASRKLENQKDSMVLNKIGSLSMPGLRELKIRDMVKIREEDAFTEFRVTLRSTLAASVEANGEVDEGLFQEELGSEIRKLERSLKKSSVVELTLPRVVNWSIAAIAGWSVAGWGGAAVGIIGESALEQVLSRPGRSDRALLAHLVSMNK